MTTLLTHTNTRRSFLSALFAVAAAPALAGFSLTAVAKQTFVNACDYGLSKSASGVDNAAAIRRAIDACHSGGTVYIPAGTYYVL